MRPPSALVLALLVSAVAVGCSRPEPTPPEVTAEYEALLEAVPAQPPGVSVARLKEFQERYQGFDIATPVEAEIDRIRALADGRYHEARELAREGEFDEAEAVLQDLATHLPETSGGESAAEHLAFDFYFGKAQWLMVRQRWEESEEVARILLDRELTRAQREQLEAILDNAGHVGAARSQAVRAQARAARRHITILLEMMYAEEGRYPSQLSLADMEAWDPMGSRSIRRALSSIEDYRATDRGASFTAVSAAGQHRIRVVDGEIEE